MKKVVLILSLLFILGACTPPQALSQQADDSGEQMQVDPFVSALMSKADETPNIKYRFSILPRLNTDVVSIKGDKAKIEINSGIDLKKFSAIYVDLSEKTVMGVCEEREEMECLDIGYTEEGLNFETNNPVTPYNWLSDIQLSAEVTGTETVNRLATTVIKYTSGQRNVKMWISDFYSLPVKVQETTPDGTATYQYSFINIGGVKDSEVMFG